jgi:hypothetical protein
MRLNSSTAIRALLFAAFYLLLLLWFHREDVYQHHFAQTGYIVACYNGFRILFIFYLFWIVAAPGLLVLRLTAPKQLTEVDVWRRLALGFLTGAGVWHVVLLGLGYLNLYTVPVAIAITLPAVIGSYLPARAAGAEIFSAFRNKEIGRGVAGWLSFGLISAAAFALLLVKGLYPDGGHDYYTHYFYYFQTVIEKGGLWPNEVWYHYFYDKGAGLYFLGLLVTDPLAPQLVTFCFMAVGALVIFLASEEAAPRTPWPTVAALLFLIIFLYTPLWGEFEKTHELTTCLVIATIWTAGHVLTARDGRRNSVWLIASLSTVIAAVIITPTIGVFLAATFGLLTAWYWLNGARDCARQALLFAIVTTLLLAGNAALNYVTTGIISDQVLVSTWPVSNLEKISHWGALAVVFKQYSGLIGLMAERLPWSDASKLLEQSLRLDLIYPFIASAAAAGGLAYLVRVQSGQWAGPLHAPQQGAVLIAALAVFVALLLATGLVQPISFYRYAGFTVPLMLVGATSLWGLPLVNPWAGVAHNRTTAALVCALSVVTFALATPPGDFFTRILPRAAAFAVGNLSIDNAYTLQPGTPSIPTVSAIYPGARGAYSVIGPGVPIRSFHYLTYCMLPGCRIESETSFLLPQADAILFGSPEQARSALQASGHNYFLFSRELPVADDLISSALFSPDDIAGYLGTKWTDGTTTLLTWLGPGVQPLGQDWIASYRAAVQPFRTQNSFYETLRQVFAQLNATPHPWRPFPLPWSTSSHARQFH